MPAPQESNGQSERPRASSAAPTFSVVVPMWNEERYAEQALGSLIDQDYPAERFEVLVVDGQSTDKSRDIVRRLSRARPGLRLLDNPARLPAAGRNVGVRAARGRLVAIVDCHSYVRPDFLRIAERTFEETGADCLGRPVELFIPGDSYIQRVIGAARTSWLGHDPHSLAFAGAARGALRGQASPLSHAVLYRREVFSRVGLFDERFDACEDVEFNSRVEEAGLMTWTEPDLVCFHHPRGSLWALFKQMRRYAQGRYELRRTRRRAFRATQAVPGAALAAWVAILVAGAADRLPPVVPTSLCGLYFVLLLFASFRASLARGFRYLPLLPIAYLAIHSGAAVGLCEAAARDGLRSGLWALGLLPGRAH